MNPTDSLALLTNSRAKVARACQRLHKLQYIDGFRPRREHETTRFGSLFHDHALAPWWLAKENRLDAALLALAEVAAEPFDRASAEALIVGYDTRWGSEQYEVIGVEVEFRAPLLNPETGHPSRTFQMAGKLDGILRDLSTGQKVFMEHKTSSENITPGSEYWRRLRIDGQVSIYFDGARALGHDVQGCLYDVIGKPGLKPLKATPIESRKYTKDGALYAKQRTQDETPAEYRARVLADIAADPNAYFQRSMVVRLEAELDEARFDLWQLATQLREADRARRYPRNPDACSRYNRTCQFFDVCTGAASLDDQTLFLRSDDVHPELSKEKPS